MSKVNEPTNDVQRQRIIGYIAKEVANGKTAEYLTAKNGWSDEFGKKVEKAIKTNDLTIVDF